MRLFALFLAIFLSTALSCQKDQVAPRDNYWVKEDPARHGFDRDALKAITKEAAGLPNFYALLVVRDGKLVLEEYYKGKRATDLFHLRSITKNVTSALAGIAIGEGTLDSVDVAIKTYFPDLIRGDKEAITIRHLLNMASGLEWDEDREIIDLIEGRIPQPVPYLLSRELTAPPASAFNYNSLSPHVVARILTQEAGQSLRAIATDKLFRPLGIERFEWSTDPQGAEWGGFGLQLSARDLAKLGQLYLDEGRWAGRQVVPADWARQSATQQIETSGPNSGYSYQWWISRNQDTPIFYGQGFGGQALMLAPAKKMIVVAFQEYLVSNDQFAQQWKNFVERVFLPVYRAAE